MHTDMVSPVYRQSPIEEVTGFGEEPATLLIETKFLLN